MTKKICLLWQNVITGQEYHIGDLVLKETGDYAFKHDDTEGYRGLYDALKNGYHLHPST